MFTMLPDSDVALIEDVIPRVTETVTVRPTSRVTKVEKGRTFVGTASSTWSAEQLLSYVATQIQQLHGPFPRDPKKEVAIMRSFAGRWAEQAGPIAQYAFEVAGGMWRKAPISITRFCLKSDPYFAEIIAKEL
jgi:hypothetical protein